MPYVDPEPMPARPATAVPGDVRLPVLETACTDCGGTGVVMDAAWVEWFERSKEAEKAWRASHPGGTWWNSEASRQMEATAPTGPEEVACAECDGVGAKPTEAGYAVLAFLRRHTSGGDR